MRRSVYDIPVIPQNIPATLPMDKLRSFWQNKLTLAVKPTIMSKKKKVIIDATIDCIAKYGLNKTNAQLVAKELGIAQSSIFYHFPQQQILFDSLIKHIAEHNEQVVKSLLKPQKTSCYFERLCQYVKGNLEWAMAHKNHVTVLLYALTESKYSSAINADIVSILKKGEDQIYFYLVAGVAEGEFQVKGNLRSLAKLISQSVYGSVMTQFQIYDQWHIDSYMNDFSYFLSNLIERSAGPSTSKG